MINDQISEVTSEVTALRADHPLRNRLGRAANPDRQWPCPLRCRRHWPPLQRNAHTPARSGAESEREKREQASPKERALGCPPRATRAPRRAHRLVGLGQPGPTKRLWPHRAMAKLGFFDIEREGLPMLKFSHALLPGRARQRRFFFLRTGQKYIVRSALRSQRAAQHTAGEVFDPFPAGLALATRRQHVDVRRVVRHLVRPGV